MFDVAMVGRLGPEALAATGMGGMLVWALMSAALGIRTAVQTVSSRRLGEKKEVKSGTSFHNGLIMATAFGLPTSFIGWCFVDKIVPFFIQDPVATKLAVDYTSIVFISLFFSVYSFVFMGFYTGIEKTKTSEISPANSAGISMDALSDSSTRTVSSFETLSLTDTKTSLTSALSIPSPRSGNLISFSTLLTYTLTGFGFSGSS